jgi:hypothetical protein
MNFCEYINISNIDYHNMEKLKKWLKCPILDYLSDRSYKYTYQKVDKYAYSTEFNPVIILDLHTFARFDETKNLQENFLSKSFQLIYVKKNPYKLKKLIKFFDFDVCQNVFYSCKKNGRLHFNIKNLQGILNKNANITNIELNNKNIAKLHTRIKKYELKRFTINYDNFKDRYLEYFKDKIIYEEYPTELEDEYEHILKTKKSTKNGNCGSYCFKNKSKIGELDFIALIKKTKRNTYINRNCLLHYFHIPHFHTYYEYEDESYIIILTDPIPTKPVSNFM